MADNKLKILLCSVTLGTLMSCNMHGQSGNKDKGKQKPRSIAELFEHMDTDEDGKLSKKEVKGPLKRDFAKIDINEDGFLSKEEIKKAPKPDRKGHGKPGHK
ncbi:EF-hand domain-containing protein [Spongiimicrobium sp. 3-5]|uniref:EF-hand domain-containing protein n=1 Tax=Spongiimicrobium sp. 3-5 TaxID=3332596 RepID=UPI00397FD79C